MLDNKVFLHVQIDNPSLLGMVFMPIGLGGFGQLDVDTIGMIYEFYDQAMPRSVNGYPCFATCRFINKTDWEKAHRILLREYERRETQLAEELEAPMPTYRILRFYQGDHPAETLKTGISLAEAKAHCSDPENSSKTCTNTAGKLLTEKYGEWFDGWTEET